MSNYIPPRKIRLRLKALSEVAKRLSINIDELSLSSSELLCSQERVQALGDSISRHILKCNSDVTAPCNMKPVNPEIESHYTRAIALYSALNENEHALLGAMVMPELLPADREILEKGQEIAKKGKNIDAVSPEIDGLLSRLSDSVRAAHNRISAVEKDVIEKKTGDTLRGLGYDVRVKSKGANVLMRGIKADLSIAANIDKSGSLSIDMAGFEGGTCKMELENLMGKLVEAGIIMEDRAAVFHGKKEGGVLAQEATRELPFVFNPLRNNNNRRRLYTLSRQRKMVQR